MAAVLPPRAAPAEQATTSVSAATAISARPRANYIWALTRISLGWVFLWAFLDKTFGLGFATDRADAWVNGGSPTFGFLTFGTSGPFAETFQGIAGAAWADWLFMLGLLGVGVALIVGVGMRLAAAAGAAMMLLMWLAAPPTTNPFMDDHVVYALVLAGLTLSNAGQTLGLGSVWERLAIVQRFPILK